jgi:hypothetical protein
MLTFGPGVVANGKAAAVGHQKQKEAEDKSYKCDCSEIVPTNNPE